MPANATELTSYHQRLQQSVNTLENIARMAGRSVAALADAERDPDLDATIGGIEGGRLHNRGQEVLNELAALAEVAGIFTGARFSLDLDVIVLLRAAQENLHGEYGRIMIRGQGLTTADEARLKLLSETEKRLGEIIKRLGTGK